MEYAGFAAYDPLSSVAAPLLPFVNWGIQLSLSVIPHIWMPLQRELESPSLNTPLYRADCDCKSDCRTGTSP